MPSLSDVFNRGAQLVWNVKCLLQSHWWALNGTCEVFDLWLHLFHQKFFFLCCCWECARAHTTSSWITIIAEGKAKKWNSKWGQKTSEVAIIQSDHKGCNLNKYAKKNKEIYDQTAQFKPHHYKFHMYIYNWRNANLYVKARMATQRRKKTIIIPFESSLSWYLFGFFSLSLSLCVSPVLWVSYDWMFVCGKKFQSQFFFAP